MRFTITPLVFFLMSSLAYSDGYDDVEAVGKILRGKCPVSSCAIVGIGRSPTPFIAYLQKTFSDDYAFTIPLSGFRYGVAQHDDLNPEMEKELFNHFRNYFPEKIKYNKLILIDYVSSGESLVAAGNYIRKYLRKEFPESSIEIVSIGIHGEDGSKTGVHPDILTRIVLPKASQLHPLLSDGFFDDMSQYGEYKLMLGRPEVGRSAPNPRYLEFKNEPQTQLAGRIADFQKQHLSSSGGAMLSCGSKTAAEAIKVEENDPITEEKWFETGDIQEEEKRANQIRWAHPTIQKQYYKSLLASLIRSRGILDSVAEAVAMLNMIYYRDEDLSVPVEMFRRLFEDEQGKKIAEGVLRALTIENDVTSSSAKFYFKILPVALENRLLEDYSRDDLQKILEYFKNNKTSSEAWSLRGDIEKKLQEFNRSSGVSLRAKSRVLQGFLSISVE